MLSTPLIVGHRSSCRLPDIAGSSQFSCVVLERMHAAGAADQWPLLLVLSAERSTTQCFEVPAEQRHLQAAGRWPLLLVLAWLFDWKHK